VPDGGMCMVDEDCCFGVCTNGICEDIPCVPDGGECEFSDQCCDGICVEDPNNPGTFVCDPECIPVDGSCTSNGDCCEGLCNPITELCEPGGGCIPLGGQGCVEDIDCCEGLCVDGFCGIITD
jgi:hypothetical protein